MSMLKKASWRTSTCLIQTVSPTHHILRREEVDRKMTCLQPIMIKSRGRNFSVYIGRVLLATTIMFRSSGIAS